MNFLVDDNLGIWSIVINLFILLILLLQFGAGLAVLMDGREIAEKHAWLLILIILPFVGFFLYLFLGRNTRNPGKKDDLADYDFSYIDRDVDKEFKQSETDFEKYDEWNDAKKIVKLIQSSANYHLSSLNQIKVFYDGQSKFDNLIVDIRKAKKFIFLDYFIWRNDELTTKIANELIKKSNEGIKIYILVDHIGSYLTKRAYFSKLEKNGIKFLYSYRFTDFFHFNKFNYRDHRKIVVIDGLIGYMGGMNMGQEYIDGGKRFDSWQDIHIRIDGGQTRFLYYLFIKAWQKAGGEDLSQSKDLRPEIGTFDPKEYKTLVQLVSSGPESKWNSIEQTFFNMISNANQKINIISPYFVPSESVLTSIKTAALSGIEINILMTGIPDKYLPFWSAHRYLREVLEAGAKVFMYKKGFLHSKAISIDGIFCTFGSANMDLRSFRLNHELNAVIYDKNITANLDQYFDDLSKNSVELKLSDSIFNKKLIRFRDEIAALFSPLL